MKTNLSRLVFGLLLSTISAHACTCVPGDGVNGNSVYNVMQQQPPSVLPPYHFPLYDSCHASVELFATVRIDSVWNLSSSIYGYRRGIQYTVLSATPFDASVLTNSRLPISPGSLLGPFGWMDTNLLQYDTAGFKRTIIDSMFNSDLSLSKGIIYFDVFLFQCTCANNLTYLNLSQSKCCFLQETNPPFPVKQALAYFNTYVNANGIYRGMHAPNPLKLGPVYSLNRPNIGDLGWKLAAYNDSTYWYFRHYAGTGDCPLGCTEYMFATYRIAQSGTVERITCFSSGYPTCIGTSIFDTKKSVYIKPLNGKISVFDIRGRCIVSTSGVYATALDVISALHLSGGIFFIISESGGVQRVLKTFNQ